MCTCAGAGLYGDGKAGRPTQPGPTVLPLGSIKASGSSPDPTLVLPTSLTFSLQPTWEGEVTTDSEGNKPSGIVC